MMRPRPAAAQMCLGALASTNGTSVAQQYPKQTAEAGPSQHV
jgi:hypothetical protein